MSQSTELDLTSSTFKANPFPVYAQIQDTDPVYLLTSSNEYQTWLITRYQDADTALRDERFVKERKNTRPPDGQMPGTRPPASAADLMSMMMVDFDPPDHTRLRALAMLSFTPRVVEQWRGRIQEITDELIDAVRHRGQMDLIEDFAFLLPIRVISEVLGIPVEDNPRLHLWTKRIADALGDPVAYQLAGEALQDFYTYLLAFIKQKRHALTDDLVSRLIQAESDGDHLSERELVVMVFLLIVAGHDTTGSLIGNSMLDLLTHPDQMELLKQRPELIKTAVEEFLRYRSPFMHATQRWAREDVELGGKLIRRGDQVMVALAAANRDKTEFKDADILNIQRQDNRHLAFGMGIHYCLGASLGRMEAQIAISTLLRRLPDLQLPVDPQTLVWRPGSLALGLHHLPVTFSQPNRRGQHSS